MKYIISLAIVIFLVRIDFWLALFEQTTKKISSSDKEAELSGVLTSREIISVKNDRSLQRSSRERFFSLLEDFHSDPSSEIRLRAIKILKENPEIFNQYQDKHLEAQIFKWRDLLIMNQKETVYFIFEMMKFLQNENKDTLNRFLSLWMEINMENFISSYHSGPDSNCSIVLVFGDPVSEEEKTNLLYERQEALKEFLSKEDLDIKQKSFATNCLLQLNVQIDKVGTRSPENLQNTEPVNPILEEVNP